MEDLLANPSARLSATKILRIYVEFSLPGHTKQHHVKRRQAIESTLTGLEDITIDDWVSLLSSTHHTALIRILDHGRGKGVSL